MIRLALISLLLAAPAAAQSQAAANMWDVFLKTCTPAFAVGRAFVDGLPSWAPAGSFATVSSEDGKMFKADILTGRYHYNYSVTILGPQIHESCSTTYTGPDLRDAAGTLATVKSAITAGHPQAIVVGGQFPEHWRERSYGENDAGYFGPIQKNVEDYHLQIAGLHSIPDTFVFVQVVEGYISIAGDRLRNGSN